MPIKRLTPKSAVKDYFENVVANRERALAQMLIDVGEQCVVEARTNGRYMDQTGNLRSSVGYVVVVDGKLLKTGEFSRVKNGSEGSSDGASYAKSLIGKFPKGIALIVVAGMNYASYVSAKGLNVLDSSELLAEKLVPRMLKQLGFK